MSVLLGIATDLTCLHNSRVVINSVKKILQVYNANPTPTSGYHFKVTTVHSKVEILRYLLPMYM